MDFFIIIYIIRFKFYTAFGLCYDGKFKRFGGGDSGGGFASDGFDVRSRG